MISYLRGLPIVKNSDYVILDVKGVGYKVFVSQKTSEKIGQEETQLFCFLNHNENAMDLYGFLSEDALRSFEILNDVSGIGPKAALVLSSLGTTEELRKAIRTRDFTFFNGIKGIGPKKIQKIILELTGRFEDIPKAKLSNDEAVQALIGLGYSQRDAKEALSQIDTNLSSEERVKEALKLFRN